MLINTRSHQRRLALISFNVFFIFFKFFRSLSKKIYIKNKLRLKLLYLYRVASGYNETNATTVNVDGYGSVYLGNSGSSLANDWLK